jgi:hypothetical protein
MKKIILRRVAIFIITLLYFSSLSSAQNVTPDSVRAVWIPNTSVWSNSPPRMAISHFILSKAQEYHYNYGAVLIAPEPLYWSYWGISGTDPFITSGSNAGTLLPGARQYFKDVIKNAFRQLDSFNLKLIPFLNIGQHGYISGWPKMSEAMALNFKRFSNSKRNTPLPGANGFPLFIEDIRTQIPSKSRYDRTTSLRTIRDTVRAGNIAGSSDSMSFIFQQWDGYSDCTLSTHVLNIPATNAKVGVMIRDSLAAGSRYAMMCDSGNNVCFQYRQASKGPTLKISGRTISLPVWLKIQRNGNIYTGSYSNDNINWTTIGTATINFDSLHFDDFIGIATTSCNKTTSCVSIFEETSWYTPEKPVASTPFAPDTGIGHFDRVFDTVLTIIKEAFNEVNVEPGFKYHSLEYLRLGEDECITDGDTSRAYFLIGECTVDQNWIQARYSSLYGGDVQKTVQNLMGSEIKHRVNRIKAIFGSRTQVMVYADMWDRNMYDSKDNWIYPALSPANYPTSSSISTWGVVNTDSAKSIANNLILHPWRYGDPASYNTYDTYKTFKASGFKFQYPWSLMKGAPSDNLTMLSQFVLNNWRPEFANYAIGYMYADFTSDSAICVKGMYYNVLWDQQMGKYSASLINK